MNGIWKRERSKMQNCSVEALYGFVDLQRKCERDNVCLSKETNRYMVYSLFEQIGFASSQILIKKRTIPNT